MNGARKTALALMLAAALFAFAVVALLVFKHRAEVQSGVLVNPKMAELKAQLNSDSETKPIQPIRKLDQELRQDYFRARRRNEAAGYMVAAATIAFVLGARWFFNQARQTPRKRVRLTESDEISAKRKNSAAVAASVLILFGGLAYLAFGRSSPYRQNWPNLRGAGNLGIAPAGAYPTEWSTASGSRIAWKTAIPAAGKSSPVVWGDRVFLTGGDKSVHHVMCFDRGDGSMLWDNAIASQPGAAETSSDAGYAPSTGATDGKRFFAIFPDGTLVAYDFDGSQVWLNQLGIPDNQYGFATSLIVYEGTLIIQFDQGPTGKEKKSNLIGLDAATGKPRWSTPRDLPNSWSTPSLIKTAQREELITCADPFIVAYDPKTGAELWRFKGLSGDIVPSPAFDGERVIVTVNRTFAIRPGGSGDVTTSNTLWRNSDATADIASPATDGKRVYLVAGSGLITCVGAADGKLLWEQDLNTPTTASPIVADVLEPAAALTENQDASTTSVTTGQDSARLIKAVFFLSEDGVTRILKIGDKYEQISQGEIGEPIHVTPAFADGQIYIRGEKNLFCVK